MFFIFLSNYLQSQDASEIDSKYIHRDEMPLLRCSCASCESFASQKIEEYDATTECTYSPSDWCSEDALSVCPTTELKRPFSEKELVEAVISGLHLSNAEVNVLREINSNLSVDLEDKDNYCTNLPLAEFDFEVCRLKYRLYINLILTHHTDDS